MRVYRQLGEQDGIGSTMHDLRVDGKRIVVDCGGSFYEKNGVQHNVPPASFLEGEHVDVIVITHTHGDHIFYAARLMDYHPEATVIMASDTFKLAGDIMLPDSLKIGLVEIKKANNLGLKIPRPMITERELGLFRNSQRVQLVDDDWFELQDWGRIGLYRSGHVLGAVSVFIEPPKSGPIYFTGDISSHYQRVVPGVMLPPDSFIGDFFDHEDVLMITEATNGSRDPVRSRADEEKLLESNIRKVLNRGGVADLKTFALARSTEAALICEAARIVPYVDGMAVDCMWQECPRLIREKKVKTIPTPQNRDERIAVERYRRELASGDRGPVVLIAPSGTLNGGYAVTYAKETLPNPKSGVFFLGHIFEGSGAEQVTNVMEKGHTVHLSDFGEDVPVNVRCDVFRHDFTSHDYRSPLVERVGLVKPPTLFVHHAGEYEGVGGYDGLVAGLSEAGCTPPRVEHATHMKELVVD